MRKMIIGVLLLCGLAANVQAGTNDVIWTVGTETNGSPIQQVEWLFRDDRLIVTNCPIWAGTPLTILEEKSDRVKIKCDRDAVPRDEKWSHAILKGDIVVGWLPRSALVKVPFADWKRNRGSAQPTPGGDSQPARRGSRTPQE